MFQQKCKILTLRNFVPIRYLDISEPMYYVLIICTSNYCFMCDMILCIVCVLLVWHVNIVNFYSVLLADLMIHQCLHVISNI